LMLARIRVMRTTRGHLSRETWRVSIRAVPKNYLIYQGNPDDGPCRGFGWAVGSVFKGIFKDDVDKGEEGCSQP
jgi:hypothetical protein